jgi:DNA-3-methyladenine glycosylase II
MNSKALLEHFQNQDRVIFGLIEKNKLLKLKNNTAYFEHLAESIVCQQLSEKAGATIWKRFQELFPGKIVTPQSVKLKNIEELRPSGISFAKAGYIHNLADAFINQIITPEKFADYTDEQVISQLILVKGVGRWTAEMFLIFSLGREDVFSFGDAGLVRAVNNLYGKGKKLPVKQIEKIVRKWSPYRSYASLLLWKSLDNT